jgi:hypothetical protein
MTESLDPACQPEPALTEAERRQQVILRCTKQALSKAQKALEAEHFDLRRVLNNYMGGYCRYLPEVCDYESARDFIACVIYGMGIEAISMERGTKLLYGAQVALAAFRPHKEPR